MTPKSLLLLIAIGATGLSSPGITKAQTPEFVLQTGHAGQVDQLAFSPDRRLLASAGADGVKLWDLSTSFVLRDFAGDELVSSNLVFTPDGKFLIFGTREGALVWWDVTNGRLFRSSKVHSQAVRWLDVDRSGNSLVSCAADGTVVLSSIKDDRVLHSFERFSFPAVAASFTHDNRITAVSRDVRALGGTVSVRSWDSQDYRLVNSFEFTRESIDGLAFGAFGQQLVVASSGALTTIDVGTGQSALTREAAYGGAVTFAVSIDGREVALSSLNSASLTVLVDRASTLKLNDKESSGARSLAFSSDGRLLASGDFSGIIAIRDLANDGALTRLDRPYLPVYSVAFGADGKNLAMGSQNGVRFWSGQNGMLGSKSKQKDEIASVSYSPDGRTLAVVRVNGSVELADPRGNRPAIELGGRANGYCVSFSPDGRRIAWGEGTAIQVRDTLGGGQGSTLRGGSQQIERVAYSPDGTTILCAEGAALTLRSAETGQLIRRLTADGQQVNAVAFSPTGRVVASGTGGGTVNLFDVNDGRLVNSIRAHSENVPFVVFQADGKTLASGSFDKTVKLWDVGTGKLLHTFEGYYIAMSPNGRLIATGSDDGESSAGSRNPSLAIYNVDTGELRIRLLSLQDNDWLTFTPDGLFDGSPNAWARVLWRFSQDTFDVAPAEAFFNEYYYPGLLAEILAGNKPRASVTVQQKDRRQPKVELELAAGGASTNINARTVGVRILIKDAPAGARDLRLFRNGSLVKAWRGELVKGIAQQSFEAKVTITAGPNRLTAYCFNRDNVKSLDASLAVSGSPAIKRSGKLYIVAIGINRYSNPEFNLKYAAADAQAFGEELAAGQKRIGAFEAVQVVSLIDDQATKENILAALRALAGGTQAAQNERLAVALSGIKTAQPEDSVVIYFAGHGVARSDRFYLVPHDLGYMGPRASMDNRTLDQILKRGISDEEIQTAIEGIDAGSMLMVIDACNSGQVLEAEEKRRGPMNSRGLAQLAYEKGMYVLTASQSFQAALEAAQLGHGYLTFALLEGGPRGGNADASPRDGKVTVREWLDYAATRVPQLQTQTMRASGGRILTFVEGEEKISDSEKRSLQRPRVYYRREVTASNFVIAVP
jgi:WD40 repeat protein/uncharacterized caspase-like protein